MSEAAANSSGKSFLQRASRNVLRWLRRSPRTIHQVTAPTRSPFLGFPCDSITIFYPLVVPIAPAGVVLCYCAGGLVRLATRLEGDPLLMFIPLASALDSCATGLSWFLVTSRLATLYPLTSSLL